MLKESKGESKIPICRTHNLCLQPSGIVPRDSDLPLFSLSPYLIHLPLRLPHWHMNAIFHLSSFLPSFLPSFFFPSFLPPFFFFFSLSPSVSVWLLLGDCSSTNGNTTWSCLLNTQCGHELWAPRNSKGQEWRKKQKRLQAPLFSMFPWSPVPKSQVFTHCRNSFPSAQMAITSTTHILSMVEIIIFVIWIVSPQWALSEKMKSYVPFSPWVRQTKPELYQQRLEHKQHSAHLEGTDVRLEHTSFHLAEQYIKANWRTEVTHEKLNYLVHF